MQKDFKIGLAIGVTLAAGAVLWLATLPNLSARARALEAASNLNPSPKIPTDISPSVALPQSKDDLPPTPSIENRASSIENPDTNGQIQTANAQQQPRIHVVQKGDTLSSISAKYYGSVKQWRKILNANRTNLSDPNRLIPGTKLIIPE